MKKLLALLMAVLVLLSMPLTRARAEEEGPAADPPAAETPAPTAEPTAEPTPEPTATPTPTAEPIFEPTAEPTPEPTEESTPVPAPEETPALAEEPPILAEEPEGPQEGSADQPRYTKSLRYWERQRATVTLTGELREDILIIARSQLGYSADATYYEETETGKKRYYTRYGDWYGSKFCDWCDAFVSFCIYYAGNETYPMELSCTRHMMNLKQQGYWREWNSYVPQKGDIVFFLANKDGNMPAHVGLVEEVIPAEDGKPGQLITIEGNQRNPDGKTPCVRRMVRDLDTVIGYGTYEKGTVYPEGYSLRSQGYLVIDETSPHFVEAPTKEAMAFLGMVNTRYYEYWFPENAEDEADVEVAEEPEEDLAPEPAEEPEKDPAPEPEPEPEPQTDEPVDALPPQEETLPKPQPGKGRPGSDRDSLD